MKPDIKNSTIPELKAWAHMQPERWAELLCDHIMNKGWKALDQKEIADFFMFAMNTSADHYCDLLGRRLILMDIKLNRLIESLNADQDPVTPQELTGPFPPRPIDDLVEEKCNRYMEGVPIPRGFDSHRSNVVFTVTDEQNEWMRENPEFAYIFDRKLFAALKIKSVGLLDSRGKFKFLSDHEAEAFALNGAYKKVPEGHALECGPWVYIKAYLVGIVVKPG